MKFRILSNGNLFRAQVKTFIFWRDLDSNGYRHPLGGELYTYSYRVCAAAAIKKFTDRRQSYHESDGPWGVVEEHY